MPPAAAPERPTLPDYDLLRPIGRGSYGDVWLARGVTGAYRAVKIVWRSRFEDAQPYEREFKGLTEFAAISLEESRQLALLHVGRTPEFFYYVMELADDRERGREIVPETYVPHTLKDTIAEGPGRPAPEVLRLGLDLAQALAGLHARGLVHRDIKPSNVIFVSRVPKLADIGLVATASAGLTFVGTEGYVPPEGPGAPAADVYSLGKVLYELATGLGRSDYPRLPPDLHRRPDRRELLELNEVILRACAAHPENRYTDAAALLDDLRLLQAGRSVRRLRLAERRLGRALRLAAALALVAAVAGTGAWVERRRADEELGLRRRAEAERDALARRSVYAATLAQAQRAIESGDFGRAQRLLVQVHPENGEADGRGIEWHALRRLAQGDPNVALRTEGPPIDSLHLSPDRRLLAVPDEARKVTLHDTADGRERLTIAGVVRLAGFSADGRWLVGTGTNPLGHPQRWSVADGQPAPAPRGARAVRAVAALGDHRLVALVEPRRPARTPQPPLTLAVWDFAREEFVVQVPLDEPGTELAWDFLRAAANRAGDRLAIVCVKGRGAHARLRTTTVRIGATVELRHDEIEGFYVSGFVRHTSPDGGSWLALDRTTGRVFEQRDGASGWTRYGRSLPPGTAVAASVDGTARGLTLAGRHAEVWLGADFLEDRSVLKLRGHRSVVTALAAPDDAETFFSASRSGELRLWRRSDVARAQPVRQCWDSQARRTRLVYSPDGALLYAPESGDRIGQLDARTLAVRATLHGAQLPVRADADTLWAESLTRGALLEFDVRDGRPRRRVEFDAQPFAGAAISSNGQWAAILTQSGSLQRARLDTPGAPPEIVPGKFVDEWIESVSDDGRYVWTGNVAGRVSCFELPAGTVRWQRKVASSLANLHRHAPSGRIAVAAHDGDICFVSETDGRVLGRMPSGSAAAQCLQFLPHSDRLAAASIEGTVEIVAPEWRAHLASLPGGGDPLHVVVASPAGDQLATLSKNGLLRVVPLR